MVRGETDRDLARDSTALGIVIPVAHQFNQLSALLLEIDSLSRSIPLVVVEASPGPTKASPNQAQRYRARAQVAALGGQWFVYPASRGGQIAQGIAVLNTPWCWVVHADTRYIEASWHYLTRLSQSRALGWGRFDVSLSGSHWGLPIVAYLMNWRSRRTRMCTGDQAMFFHRSLLDRIGGFPPQPLMEDIEVSRRLQRLRDHQFFAPAIAITASGARWERQGWLKTVLSMWWYRACYYFGVSAEDLYQRYYGPRP